MQDTTFSPEEIRRIIEKLKNDSAFRQKVLDILNI